MAVLQAHDHLTLLTDDFTCTNEDKCPCAQAELQRNNGPPDLLVVESYVDCLKNRSLQMKSANPPVRNYSVGQLMFKKRIFCIE